MKPGMPQHIFTRTLLQWFARHGRELPWRGTRDPYAIWLSEVILQQTRVDQGRDYWERFMRRFPTVEALAAAGEDEVMRLWQGLGYYSRARHLHAAARQVAAMGRFPDSYDALLSLPGVGAYTAAAVASIAFNRPHAVVDGNVYRVLARYFGITTAVGTTAARKEFQALAQELLPAGQASAFNQAMMDFGAVQCVPVSPRCDACPLHETCHALRHGRVKDLPVKQRKVAVKTRRMACVYVRCDGMTALRRRPAGDIWQGLWEPLMVEDAPLPPLEGRLTQLAAGVRHVLTHRVILADFYLLETGRRPPLPAGYQWIPEDRLDDYAVPRLVELLYSKINNMKDGHTQ